MKHRYRGSPSRPHPLRRASGLERKGTNCRCFHTCSSTDRPPRLETDRSCPDLTDAPIELDHECVDRGAIAEIASRVVREVLGADGRDGAALVHSLEHREMPEAGISPTEELRRAVGAVLCLAHGVVVTGGRVCTIPPPGGPR